ncbi:ABC transporter permease [Roseomonas sp. GC11]|uniref:ABC transporter permease n=1 Tax=Roseomonas sp. GC11 TaxID=2950546 RepID=UPI002109DC8A|nr:ABC transporter permease [Roseomonas sp. GC11]MCQ4158596.1 ABC transporter permease [Roseomonas sp. GC11]
MSLGTRGRGSAAALVLPATIFVALTLLVPLALLFRYSLNAFIPGQFMVEAVTLENYVKFFTDPFYTTVLWRTFRIAALVTVICLVAGFPLAYVLARTQSRHKPLLLIAVVLPLFVGNAVRAAGWMVAFGAKGVVNASLLGLGFLSVPLDIMFTETAVVIGITAVNLPFMVLSLQSVIEGIDRALEEAAFNLGAPPSAMIRRVLVPLAAPGIAAGCILTFILGMNAYATPVLIGGPRFQTMGPLVYGQVIEQNNWPFGAAVAFILMTATLVLTLASSLLVRRKG